MALGYQEIAAKRRRAARTLATRLRGATATVVEGLEMRLLLSGSPANWISTVSGNWNNPANWDVNRVPGVNDDVVINMPNVTVTVNSSQAAASLSVAGTDTLEISAGQLSLPASAAASSIAGSLLLDGGTLATAQAINASGATTWSSGSISGVGPFNNSGTVTVTGASVHDLFGGIQFKNTGSFLDQATGDLRFFDASAFNNQATGLFDFQASTTLEFNSGGGGQFVNLGTVRKSVGAGTGQFNVPFNNQGGTIDVKAGQITLAGGGTEQGGTLNAAAGAALDLTGGNTTTFTGTFTGSGAGAVLLQSGTMAITGSATFNLPTGLFQWSGGAINGGMFINKGFVTLIGATVHDLNNGTTFDNQAKVIDQATGDLRFFDASNFTNESTGTFDFQNDTAFEFNTGGGGQFNNMGTLRKSAGTGTDLIGVPLNNSANGIIDVQTGRITIGKGGNDLGGTFTVAAGAFLDLTGGATTNLTGTYTGSGAGTVLLQNGVLAVSAATFNFPTGLFQWTGGTIAGGTLTNVNSITLSGASAHDLASGATISNSATITDQATGDVRFFDVSTVLNSLGATFDFQSTGGLQFNTGGGGKFNNLGIVRKSVSAGSVSDGVPLNNQGGILDIQTGVFSLAGGGTSTSGTFNVATGAILDLTGGTVSNIYGGTYSGSGGGQIRLQNGTVNIPATGATFNFPAGYFQWIGGTLITGPLQNTGSITLAGATVKDLANGIQLTNTGTITDSGTGDLRFFDASALNNQGTGIFDFQNSGGMQFNTGGGGNFNNFGTVRGSSTNTAALIGVPFNNSPVGLIDVQAGRITIGRGGTSTGGIFNTAVGAVLDLTGGSTTILGGSYSGIAGGTVLLQNGTLQIATGGATFHFNPGTFQWTGGTIVGAPLSNMGALTIAGSTVHDLASGVVINNTGTVTDTGTGDLRFFDLSAFNNLAGGLFDFKNDSSFEFNTGGGGSFTNIGTLRKSAGIGNSSIGVPLSNQGGVIDVQTGQISLAGNGTSTSGTFNASTGAVLDLTGGTVGNVYGGTYSGSGGGTVRLQSGTLHVAPTGATFNFPTGYLQWTGGTIVGGALLNSGFLTIASSTVHDLASGVIINNAGTVIDAGAGDLRFFDASVFNNQAAGLFDFQNDGGFEFNTGGGGVFNNLGTVRKSAGAGNSIDSVPLNIQGGTIDVRTGQITLAGGGTSTGGTLNAVSGAVLDLTGGTVSNTFGGTYVSGTGTGQVILQGGALKAAAGGANFNLSATSPFIWAAGSITGGPFTNSGALSIQGASVHDLFGTVTFNNTGNIVDSASGDLRFFDASILNNQATGVFDFQGAGSFEFNSGGGGSLNNAGLFSKSIGAGTTIIPIPTSNTGSVVAAAGALLFSSSVAQVSGSTLTGGTWTASNGASLQISGANLSTNQGTVILSGPGSTFVPVANLSSNSGNFTVTKGVSFTAPAGLTNSGTVTVGAATTLKVVGAFMQTAAGTLAIELGGTPASGNFGVLQSLGANLGGTLKATLVNNFVPSALQQYTIETYSNHSGTFSTVNLPTSPGLMFNASVNGTNVLLNSIATLPSSSVNALPATVTSRSFFVSWTGQDYAGGQGIKFFDVYVSDNGGPFTRFVTQSAATSTVFTGVYGHTYGFYSVATDLQNNVEPTPTLAEATTFTTIPTITLTPTPIAPTAGTLFSGQVATFTDTDLNFTSGFTANITWGDGNMSTGTVTTLTAGRFAITGSNTYATSGGFTLVAGVSDGLGDASSGNELVTVAPGLPAGTISVATASTLAATVGTPLGTDQPLAVFNTTFPLTPLSAFTATINWGDGTNSSGQVSSVAGQIAVSATHTFANAGTFHPQVTLLNAGVSAVAAPTVNVFAQIGSQPAGQAKIVYFLANRVGNVIIDSATITNTGSTTIVGPVAVLVQFGLPRPPGVTLANASGSTNLAGNVTLGPASNTLFAQNSPYIIVAPAGIAPGQTVNFSLVFNLTSNVLFGFTLGALAGANLSSGAGNLDTVNTGTNGVGQQQFNATVGVPLTNVTLALFKDFGPALPPGSYAASIDWADGTPRSAGVVTSSGGLLSVAGTHTFSFAGKFTPSVTLVDPNSAAISARSVVTVTAPVITPHLVVAAIASPSPTPTPTPAPTAPPVLGATNVTPLFSVAAGGFVPDAVPGLFSQVVKVRNSSAASIAGVVSLALDRLPAGVTLLNATGFTSATSPSSSPYLDFGSASSVLQPGATLTFTLTFKRTSDAAILYTPRLLAGAGKR